MKHILIILPLILCFITSCHHIAEKSELEEFRNEKKVCDHNKEIVREVFNAIDNNDFGKLDLLLADNFSLSAPGVEQPMKKDDIYKAIKTHYAAFPNWTHNIEDIIAERDIVMVKIMQNGTHKAEYGGIFPTNKQITMAAVSMLTLVDGKVKNWWAIEDYLGFYQQLGMELKMKEEGQ